MARVLFVHHRPQASGAARSLALLIGALDPEWEAHVVVPDGAAAELFERSGATVHRGPVPAFAHTWDVQYDGLRWLVAVREALWIPAHVRQLRRLLRDLRPEIVHVNDVVMLVSGIVAARSGVPVVWHLRSSLPNGGQDRRSLWIARLIERHAATTIAIDADVSASYSLRTESTVVPNAVRVEPGPEAVLAVPAGRVSVGLFGYLRRQKGWPDYLAALRLLVDRGVPVHGVVVGGAIRGARAFRGPNGVLLKAMGVPDENRAFLDQVSELGLADWVLQLPFADDPGPILRALDIVTFPNRGAGLGRPVLEAAAYGKPVVASGSRSGGGVLADGEGGFLVRPHQPAELADALERLINDPALRTQMGAAGTAASSAFSPEAVARRVEAIWRTARRQPPAGLRGARYTRR